MSHPDPDPVSPDRTTQITWRRVVLELVRSHPRGRFDVSVHVGEPSGAHAHHTLDPRTGPLDHAVAADVVGGLLLRVPRTPPPTAWLTRPGDLAPTSADHAWLSAVRQAFAEVGLVPSLVVVTRHGWRDATSGAGHDWGRVPH